MGDEKIREVVFLRNYVNLHLDAGNDFVGDGAVAIRKPFCTKLLKAL